MKEEIKINFVDYSESLEWIEKSSKKYKTKNDFFASDEYKFAYPLIKKMYEVEKIEYSKKAMSELKKSKLQIGDSVRYDYVSPFFNVAVYTGKIVERNGVPYVKLDSGQTTMSGKKSVKWHKGFTKWEKENER